MPKHPMPLLGVDYYPEHWPEARWTIDARMMREGGLEVVRLAEFAWAKLEPADGRFEWDWLDRAIETLALEKLRIILGTPTAAPPAWLVRSHPDILPVDAQGHVRDFGSRCHYCHSSSSLYTYSKRIIQAMAERYGKYPAVIGWQLDNEFGNHDSGRCYCDRCVAGFREWLRNRYGTLDALNEAWGTVFWSQTYTDWNQINSPLLTMTEANPGQALDFYRFSSDATVAFAQMQAETLRPFIGDRFITTNLMGTFSDLDYFKLAAPLDFVTWDSYPTGYRERVAPTLYFPDAPRPQLAYDAGDPYATAFAHAITAGIKPGAPFGVMEQQCGNVNWGTYNPAPRPGIMRLWTWQSLAAGADSILYFRWRACRFAQEQMHSGMLRHDAEPAYGYQQLCEMRGENDLYKRVREGETRNEVAILFNYEDLWAMNLQSHNQDFTYWRHLFSYYAALQRAGVPCDMVSPRADLSAYKLVIAPTLMLADEVLAAHLADYIRAGGTLVLGVRSGFKTLTNVVTDQLLPGPFAELVGATVESWQSLPPGIRFPLNLSWGNGKSGATHWAEVLTPKTAQPIAMYGQGHLQGLAAATQNAVGQGMVIYVGWAPDEASADSLVGLLLPRTDVQPLAMVPSGVMAARRVAADESFTLLLNFTDAPAVAWVNADGLADALTGELVGREVPVAPRDVRILKTKR